MEDLVPKDPIRTSYRGKKWSAINPKDGTPFQVLIPQHRIQWVHKCGIGAVYETTRVVTSILQQPIAIYEGIRRERDEDYRSDSDGWLCYSASPEFGYDWESGKRIEKELRVLLVFLNKDLEVYNWRWEEEDSAVPGVPVDLFNRFRRKVLG